MNNRRREKPTPEPGQSWGIFGGAFDPIHNGHLNLAQQVRSIKGLDGIMFVPSINPPHRDASSLSPYEDRLAMVNLAVGELEHYLVSSVEGDLNLSGYSLDTIRELKRVFPGVSWRVIVGADQGELFHTWHKPEDILNEACLLIGARPGHTPRFPKLDDTSQIEFVPVSLVDLSSTDIRRRVSAGIAESDLCQLVPPAVASYIVTHQLYQQ